MQSHLYPKKKIKDAEYFFQPLHVPLYYSLKPQHVIAIIVYMYLFSCTAEQCYSKPTCKELPITVKSVHSPNPKCFES